jgi:hypothetical protein
MHFSDLTQTQKQDLHVQLTTFATALGGTNKFLSVLEEIREEKPKALLNKTAIYHTKVAKFTWGKSIFKDTLTLLYNGIRNEEKNGNIFSELSPSEYKKNMNMIRAIKPVKVTAISKENQEELSFLILDTSEEKDTKFTLLFKIFFFYNIDFAKEILNYKEEK